MMGDLDEILKQFNKWIKPILVKLNIKIRQEASGFGNTWSGLQEIASGIERLQDITRSGFIIKISEERSGFQNIWSGLDDVEREVVQLQGITRSGLAGIAVDMSGLEAINRSGFQNTWSGLNEIRDEVEDLQVIERSGFLKKIGQESSGYTMIRDEVIQLQDISRSGFNNISINISGIFNVNVSGLEIINRSGFRDLEDDVEDVSSGVRMLRQGETIALCTRTSIKGASGTVSGELGCYDRWTLYLQASGATNVTLELTPDTAYPYFWFEPSESPIALTSGTILEMGYDAVYLRIYADSGVGVTGRVRACW